MQQSRLAPFQPVCSRRTQEGCGGLGREKIQERSRIRGRFSEALLLHRKSKNRKRRWQIGLWQSSPYRWQEPDTEIPCWPPRHLQKLSLNWLASAGNQSKKPDTEIQRQYRHWFRRPFFWTPFPGGNSTAHFPTKGVELSSGIESFKKPLPRIIRGRGATSSTIIKTSTEDRHEEPQREEPLPPTRHCTWLARNWVLRLSSRAPDSFAA